MDSQKLAKIAAHLDEWEFPFVEQAIFGTTDARGVAMFFDGFCSRELGASIAEVMFYQSSMGAVAGLRLSD